MTQTFIDRDANGWTMIDFLPGVTLLPLAEPVREGSIHRARLSRGAVIPVHTHPADECVMVLTRWSVMVPSKPAGGGAKRAHSGSQPAGTRQGPHTAVTDAELLIVVLARWGLSASKAAFIHSSNTGYCWNDRNH